MRAGLHATRRADAEWIGARATRKSQEEEQGVHSHPRPRAHAPKTLRTAGDSTEEGQPGESRRARGNSEGRVPLTVTPLRSAAGSCTASSADIRADHPAELPQELVQKAG